MSGPFGSSQWMYNASSGFYSYRINQSLRFNDGDSAYLTRDPSSAGDRQKFTYSVWFKRSALSAAEIDLFSAGDSSTDRFEIILSSANPNQLEIYMNTSGTIGDLITTQVFRDVSAWYHLVVAFDTTQSTASNRVKIYINGSQITSFATETYPSQNFNTAVNSTSNQYISKRNYVNDRYYDGYMAEVNMIDGQQLTPASFGETKEGVWVPKSSSGLTFGTNGFYLPFKSDAVSEGFNVVTYLGNDTSQTLGGIGFAPDFVWLKNRDQSEVHSLYDTVRGATAQLFSSETDAEADRGVYGLTAFTGDGFTVGSGGEVNDANEKYVAWCWEAGGAPTADNSASAGATPTAGSVKIDGSNLGSALGGSIAATRLTANTSRGFSVVSWTGNGISGATIAHGLSSAPEMIFVKTRSAAGMWVTYAKPAANDAETDYLRLDGTDALQDDDRIWNDTAPTSSVFSVGSGTSHINSNTVTHVSYCFHSVSNYSKIGSYSGTGSANNSVTGLGFKPAWLMIKRVDSANSWMMLDSTRTASGRQGNYLYADTNSAESYYAEIDFDSDGFTLQVNTNAVNASGGTYIYMAFADTRESAFFKDASGQGNNFTPNNLDYRDVLLDSPTDNFCTLNPLTTTAGTYSEGNTRYLGASAWRRSNATHGISSGKWYWEYCVLTAPYGTRAVNSAYNAGGFGLSTAFNSTTAHSSVTDGVVYTDSGYFKNFSGSYTSGSAGAATSVGDIIGFAVNLEDNTFTIYKNNSSEASGTIGMTAGTEIVPLLLSYNADYGTLAANFGQDSSFAGAKAAQGNADGNGIGDFFYAPPSGFLAVCTKNLPDPTIGPTADTLATDHFNTVTYTGPIAAAAAAGTTGAVTGVGFQPDWVWIKARSTVNNHEVFDSVRGVATDGTKGLIPNTAAAEQSSNLNGGLYSLDNDGFTVVAGTDSGGRSNETGSDDRTYVSWNWKAGGSASSNSDGDITSSVSANTAAGFSIGTYTGNGQGSQTIGHGLSSAPELVIVKQRSGGNDWVVFDKFRPDTEKYLRLNENNGYYDYGATLMATPGASTFELTYAPSGYTNDSGATYVFYAFHSVDGYSKVGTYTGNGNNEGPFVFTGFRPAFVQVKDTSVGNGWRTADNKRPAAFNVINESLSASSSGAASTTDGDRIDFLSNGFKCRSSAGQYNDNNSKYIYIAFAEAPFKFANAR